jgi:N-acetyltransferase B complex (NatB) non catalytic subunit
MAPPSKLITRSVPPAEAERRLRPILEAMYVTKNVRQALKICIKAEEKRPGWPAARALRAIALHRLGRRADADAAAAAVVDDLVAGRIPADEDAAIKLHLFYRECPHREHLSAHAYELIARADPSDVYLSETSFMFHVRAREFAAAQKIATRLQRSSFLHLPQSADQHGRAKEEYALWAVASLWMANRKTSISPSLHNPKLVKLASAMLKKVLSLDASAPSARPLTAEVARFASRVMCDAADYAAASSLLTGAKSVMDVAEYGHLTADVAFQANNKQVAAELYRKLLVDVDAGDWSHWLRYIEVAPVVDSMALVEALCSQAREKGHPTSRGQFIADMELRLRHREYEELHERVVRYFGMFGAKEVCAHDLRPYVHFIVQHGVADAASICDELERSDDPMSTSQSINLSWIRLWFGCLRETPNELFAKHEALLDDDVDAMERQPGDDYLLLAAHQLLPSRSGADRYSDVDAVYMAIVLIEAGLTRSPYNFHFKLLLIRLYEKIGAAKKAFDVWSTLDIKHVQISTLGHLVVRPMFDHGVHKEFSDVTDAFDKLWLECEREIPESVSCAFADGAINAAVDFIEFRERLEQSVTLADATLCEALSHLSMGKNDTLGLERAWCVLGEDARILPENLKHEHHSLVENQDSRCMEFWDVDSYDPERCRIDIDASNFDQGSPMVASSQTTLFVEVLVTRCVIRLARGEDITGSSDLVMLQEQALDDCTSCDRAVFLRNMVLTVVQVSNLLVGKQLTGKLCSEKGAEAAVKVKANVQYLTDMTSRFATLANDAAAAPGALGMIGRFVHETIALTTLALSSLSKASLAKSSGSLPSLTTSSRDDVEEAITTFRHALSEAANAVSDAIQPFVSLGSCSSLMSCSSCAAALVPKVVSSLDESDECVDAENMRNRVDFCRDVRDDILSCYNEVSSGIIGRLQSMLQRLKFAAF